jgi:hypothetical protein
VSRLDCLVVRRGGSTWGLPEAGVRGVARDAGGLRIHATGGSLIADDVVGLARGLEVRAAGAVIRALWGERCVGLALHAGVPMVVIDPEDPPRSLRTEGASRHER